ncbi:Uncharacterised protein [Rhodococcus gordoniae]|uniref:Uncharacterized protein n=1 Tax=Rhodococcus gordoniae TaxID=223392 RepID=A0A379M5B5_9NOCA|nr:hypothetical protein [Rhodococcus gordoniae]SUE16615.1 Uncharacterised protein [Rhodococcus gordoniae]
MPQYAVVLTQSVSHTVFLEADSKEEAAESAINQGTGSLCHQCSSITDLDPVGREVCMVESEEERA